MLDGRWSDVLAITTTLDAAAAVHPSQRAEHASLRIVGAPTDRDAVSDAWPELARHTPPGLGGTVSLLVDLEVIATLLDGAKDPLAPAARAHAEARWADTAVDPAFLERLRSTARAVAAGHPALAAEAPR